MASQVNSAKQLKKGYTLPETIPKNCRERNASKFILQDQLPPGYQNQRSYTHKKKLQTIITDEHRCKNPQQNINKFNN